MYSPVASYPGPSLPARTRVSGQVTRLIRQVMTSTPVKDAYIIGERSEPLSRVFNDQQRDYIWWCPYVRTFLIRMRMYA